MADVYVGDSGFTAIAAGDEIMAAPLDAMFDRTKGFLSGLVANAAIKVTTVYATTFDTNVTAAGVTLAGTTLAADGTDSNISITITPKGTGTVILNVGVSGTAVDTDGTLAANSDTKLASQKAVKTYVDAQVAVENLWDRTSTTVSLHNSGDTLNLSGALQVNTDKFTVAAASGNTLIAGTLGVTGGITGTLATSAQTNITSLGSLTGLTIANEAGARLNLNGDGYDCSLLSTTGQLRFLRDSGAVTAYQNNQTGDWTFNGAINLGDSKLSLLGTTAGRVALSIENISDSNDGSLVNYIHTSVSPAANDDIVVNNYYSQDSAGNQTAFATERYYCPTVTNGAEVGAISWTLQKGDGTTAIPLLLQGANAIFGGNVGIGTTAPTAKLEVNNASYAADLQKWSGSEATVYNLKLASYSPGAGVGYKFVLRDADTDYTPLSFVQANSYFGGISYYNLPATLSTATYTDAMCFRRPHLYAGYAQAKISIGRYTTGDLSGSNAHSALMLSTAEDGVTYNTNVVFKGNLGTDFYGDVWREGTGMAQRTLGVYDPNNGVRTAMWTVNGNAYIGAMDATMYGYNPLYFAATNYTFTTGNLTSEKTFKVTGYSSPAGIGLELFYNASRCNIVGFNRAGGTYLPLDISASEVVVSIGATEKVKIDGAGLTSTAFGTSTVTNASMANNTPTAIITLPSGFGSTWLITAQASSGDNVAYTANQFITVINSKAVIVSGRNGANMVITVNEATRVVSVTQTLGSASSVSCAVTRLGYYA